MYTVEALVCAIKHVSNSSRKGVAFEVLSNCFVMVRKMKNKEG